jgi:release factor glutamine methyltransferase
VPAPETLDQALIAAQDNGLDRLDAQLLLLHALGRATADRAWLVAHGAETLADEAARRYRQLSQRRAGGEPLAYLVGMREFFGLELQVDPRVLIPRPDTETLVEWALDLLPPNESPGLGRRVLDLGTGSGAIAVAIKHSRPDLHVSALDASEDALSVAQANAQRLGLSIDFFRSGWFERVTDVFNLIVSNPPYVCEGDPHLTALRHEPRSALTAGTDGLNDLRLIIQQAPGYLCPGGWLLLEHGHDQSDAVGLLLNQRGFSKVTHRKDLAGIARCSGGVWEPTEP